MKMNKTPNFTPRAQKVIGISKKIAIELNSEEVFPLHLLVAILECRQFSVNSILENLSIDPPLLSSLLQESATQGLSEGQVPEYSESFKEKIKESLAFAKKLMHDYVGVEHLLYACIDSLALKEFMEELGHNSKKILKSIEDYISTPTSKDISHGITTETPLTPSKSSAGPSKDSALARFSVDYSKLAEDNKLDEVFFKDEEINQVTEILCRKSKNNPVLLGDAGVGKTAVVECLAQKIYTQECAEFLLDKRIHVVDLPSMIAGTKYRGQFEERLKELVEDASKDKRVILFIDEIHTLVGAGNSEGSMDAANILKPALARGTIKCIGATTYEEYRKTLLKDGALDRRFHPISVNEPNRDQAVKIIKKISSTYESFHGVKYTDDSIEHAVDLSKKYMPDRFLPDKAIDLIDQAASKVKIRKFRRPKNIKRAEKRLQDLFEQEEESVGDEKSNVMKKAEKAFEKYKVLLENWAEKCKQEGAEVTSEDICRVVAQKTNIPLEKIQKDYSKEALQLKDNLNKSIVGQRDAVSSINDSVMLSFSGLAEGNKPIGSFLLLGSTGLGKTHTAKMLCKFLYEKEDSFIQFDMSEFSEKTSVSRLIGASPGYVGFDEGSPLIEKVKRDPYCVVIFDEIEKAHEDVLNLFLQILEEGKLTDSVGQSADFSNAIIIMTSNVGQNLYQKTNSMGFGGTSEDETSVLDKVTAEAKKSFKLELLNRIDKIIPYNNLGDKEMREILNINIKDFQKLLKSKGIKLSISSACRDYMCKSAMKENMGARPLHRIMKEKIKSPSAKKIVENPGAKHIKFTLKSEKFKCEVE